MKRSNILTVVLILILIVLAYLWYSYSASRPQELVSSSATEATAANRELLVLLQVLESIEIDTSFFQDPLFINLKEGISLPDFPPKGRGNPFLPLE